MRDHNREGSLSWQGLANVTQMSTYTKDRHTYAYEGSGVPEQPVSIQHFKGVLRGKSQKGTKSQYSVNLEMAKAVYSNVGCSHSSRFRCVHVL